MHKLIIAEKPSTAQRIAFALAEKPVQAKNEKGARYFLIERGGKKIVVAPAVGHVYALKPADASDYPVLDAQWMPSFQVSKGSEFTKPYLDNLIKLGKEASQVYSATDYDIEGEVIAANIIEFALNARNAKRMRFSTLTKSELISAFENPEEISEGMVSAGRARHFLDLIWGISFSRALMHAISSAGLFKVMSIGRVQGPTLAILARLEKKIASFASQPYWELHALVKGIDFTHEEQRFFDKKQAQESIASTRKQGIVDKVERKKFLSLAPHPYDLTTLQVDAFRCFGFNPSQTLEVAQRLYEAGLISYPRTSSQKLSQKLDLQKIIQALAENPSYAALANKLISGKRFSPREGEKEDPAHPAIHPTGEKPLELGAQQRKLYDLIAKRFLACFAEPAKRERMSVTLLLGTERFNASGARTLERGWLEFFSPYARLEEVVLPDFKEGEKIVAEKIDLLEKQTSPPKRFTQASLVKELEGRDLGTKATRSEVIKTLFDRGYVVDKAIRVTPFGLAVFETLEYNCPQVLSEELTRKFESEMELIQQSKKDYVEVIGEGKQVVVELTKEFKKKEESIGKDLLEGFNKARFEERSKPLGECNLCGGQIVIKKSAYGLFAACNNYPQCKNTFPLPRNATVISMNKKCAQCGTPIVLIKRRARKSFQMCLFPQCPTKAGWAKPLKKGIKSS